jgi:hypothetical protein
MTWKPVTAEERKLFDQIMLWIRTARKAGAKYGLPYYSDSWLPSVPDFEKSALLERIRSGLMPMEEPPPVGYSCPWYALVEDHGPHYVFDVHMQSGSQFLCENEVLVAQNVYIIYERISEKELIVGDKRGTSYRFRLWFDPDWRHPTAYRPEDGGWLIQNIALDERLGNQPLGVRCRQCKTIHAEIPFNGCHSCGHSAFEDCLPGDG